jgi:hypothetical protein
VNAEFNWWLLIVGLVIGGGLAWLVLTDSSRREVDIEEHELTAESRWIADAMADTGRPIDDDQVLEILRLHRAYRAAPPPDDLDESRAAPDGGWPEPVDAADRRPMAHPLGPDRESGEQAPVPEHARLP